MLNYWNLILFTVTALIALYVGVIPDWRWIMFFALYFLFSVRLCSLRYFYPILMALAVILFNNYLFQEKIKILFQAGKDISIKVQIDSFLNQITHGNEYLVKIKAINGKQISTLFQPKIKLITETDRLLYLGEDWHLKVSIKPVNGRLNEAGFDQEKYFIAQNWQGKAIVRQSAENKKTADSNSLRLLLYEKTKQYTDSLSNGALLLALSFGERSTITDEQWTLLKSSGLIHLVAISGLHIGIAFLLGWNIGFVFRFVVPKWYWSPICCALLFASSYAWLAGFSLPTIRALMMCSIFAFFHLVRLQYSHWFKLLITISLLIVIDPFSLLSISFWMSFSAVAAIYLILSFPYIKYEHGLKKLIKMQIALTGVMLPFTLLFFEGVSALSPFYNLLFIPWFTFIQVPLLFFSLFITLILPNMSDLLWQWSNDAMSLVMWSTSFSKQSWLAFSSESGFILLMLVTFYSLRPLMHHKLNNVLLVTGVVCFLYAKVPRSGNLSDNRWMVSVLDVGHGLAVLIEKNDHYVLYDTGNRWRNGSVAESIITPVMLARGSVDLDGLILSHLDSDHAGGRTYIEQHFSLASKRASQKIVGYQPCIKDNNWRWQGLQFSVLWPPKMVTRAYNPHSCVINISDGQSSILLTGDIDAISEFILVKEPSLLKADVVIVPHHGSNSSSREPFIRAVNPSLAVASVAKDNQWNLPSNSVKQRYANAGVAWLDTGYSGQIDIEFDHRGWVANEQRNSQSLAWYRQMLRKGVE